jgi:hypothetical protein
MLVHDPLEGTGAPPSNRILNSMRSTAHPAVRSLLAAVGRAVSSNASHLLSASRSFSQLIAGHPPPTPSTPQAAAPVCPLAITDELHRSLYARPVIVRGGQCAGVSLIPKRSSAQQPPYKPPGEQRSPFEGLLVRAVSGSGPAGNDERLKMRSRVRTAVRSGPALALAAWCQQVTLLVDNWLGPVRKV